jgi:FkbM family methyltransferase
MNEATSTGRQLLCRALERGPRFLLDWKEARYFRRHGEIELDLVGELCRRDRDAIDAGANEGMYVLFMRRHARHVLAFEPLSTLHGKLCRRYAPDVTVHNIALSDRVGTAILHVPIAGGDPVCGLSSLNPTVAAAHPRHLEIRVPTMPLDAIYGGELGFMKIDVEGHEEAVLEGARATIARCHPRLLVECDDSLVPGARQRLVERLSGLNYAGFFVRGRILRPVADFDPDIDQRPQNLSGLGRGRRRRDLGYVSNFIFIPRTEVCALTPRLDAALAQA